MDLPFVRNYQRLFPNRTGKEQEGDEQRVEEGISDEGEISRRQWREQSEDVDEEIDEQLLKRTSQLHQALRNMKLLRFQLLQSKIMKSQNLNNCTKLEHKIAQMQEQNSTLESQNEDLQKEIHLYRQRINRQRESNRSLDLNLQAITKKLQQRKVQHKNIANNNDMRSVLQDKENISGMDNRKYLSIEKMGLEASNQSAQEMINLIKQEIATSKQNFAAKEKKKHELQAEYKQLLDSLKKQQEEANSSRVSSEKQQKAIIKQVIHLQEVYEIGQLRDNRSVISKPRVNKSTKKNNQRQRKQANTENKQTRSGNHNPSSVSTLKKYKIF